MRGPVAQLHVRGVPGGLGGDALQLGLLGVGEVIGAQALAVFAVHLHAHAAGGQAQLQQIAGHIGARRRAFLAAQDCEPAFTDDRGVHGRDVQDLVVRLQRTAALVGCEHIPGARLRVAQYAGRAIGHAQHAIVQLGGRGACLRRRAHVGDELGLEVVQEQLRHFYFSLMGTISSTSFVRPSLVVAATLIWYFWPLRPPA